MVQRFYLGAAAGIRVERYEGHDIESRLFKNRDKQMPFIVRVMLRHVLKSQIGDIADEFILFV